MSTVFLTTSEVTKIFKVSKKFLHQNVNECEFFPKPVTIYQKHDLWVESEIKGYINDLFEERKYYYGELV